MMAELLHLDRAMRALAGPIVSGDPQALVLAAQIMKRRAALLGLS